MAMEITDPKMKAQMEEARKKMNDPANQAKLEETRKRMEDPQFKAMMEQNPQLKAQMEAMLKVAAGNDPGALMPKEMVIRLKGGNSLTQINGGMMDGMEILYLREKQQAFRLDRTAKTYTPLEQDNKHEEHAVTVTKTSDTRNILGHQCTRYIIDMPTPQGGKATSDYWATTGIKGLDMQALAHHSGTEIGGQSFYFSKAEGMPLLIETTIPQGKITLTAKEVTNALQPAGDFVIPKDFRLQ